LLTVFLGFELVVLPLLAGLAVPVFALGFIDRVAEGGRLSVESLAAFISFNSSCSDFDKVGAAGAFLVWDSVVVKEELPKRIKQADSNKGQRPKVHRGNPFMGAIKALAWCWSNKQPHSHKAGRKSIQSG
jgi:hypothetical protein